MHTAIKIYKGLIEPHFDYCSVVWDGLSQQLSEKLQKLQNRAARVITKSSYNTNSNYLLNSLSWDNLSVRRKKQKANLMYKCVNKLSPNYLCNMFTPRTLSFDLRDASQKLYLPKPRTDYLKRSFSYSGASLWNDLPKVNTTKYGLKSLRYEGANLWNKLPNEYRKADSYKLFKKQILDTDLVGRYMS